MSQVVEADLLVTGAGGAGCVAAIEGKRQGARVAAAIAREVREGKGTKFGGCILDLTENRKDPEKDSLVSTISLWSPVVPKDRK